MENLFEKGCLVQLSTSIWGATRKINPSQLTDRPVSSEWFRANKKLVDYDSLRPIRKVANTSRSYLNGVSLPFPIHGMVFMPKEMISRVDGKLDDFKADFNKSVNRFISQYDDLRKMAMVYGCSHEAIKPFCQTECILRKNSAYDHNMRNANSDKN